MAVRFALLALVALALSACSPNGGAADWTLEDISVTEVHFDEGGDLDAPSIRGIIENHTDVIVNQAELYAVFLDADSTVVDRPYTTVPGVLPHEPARFSVLVPIPLQMSGEPFQWRLTHVAVQVNDRWYRIPIADTLRSGALRPLISPGL